MRILPLLAVALAATAAAAGTLDTDLLPNEEVRSTLFPAGERETFRVTAPAGSVLRLRAKSLARPALAAPALHFDLPDDDSGVARFEGATAKGSVFTFLRDGTFEFEVGSDAAAGDYSLKAALKCPRSVPLSGEAPGVAGFFAPPGATANLTVKRAPGSALVPRIDSLDGPSGPVTPGAVREGRTSASWKKVPLVEQGAFGVLVGGDDGSAGSFTGKVKLALRKPAVRDVRDISVPGAVKGAWTVLLAAAGAGDPPLPALVTGRCILDGEGGVQADLATLVPLPDAGSPLGFTLQEVPIEGAGGSYLSDGTTVALSLAVGAGEPLALSLAISGNGRVLYPDPAAPAGTFALFLLEGDAPTKANLAGPWFYADLLASAEGTTVEVEGGSLTLGSSGSVGGLGARTVVDVAGGSAGEASPILRSGSFSVAGDGAITVDTVRNLFGASDSWTVAPLFGLDILASDGGLATLASGGTLLLRQGTGLTNADAAGTYLHLGVALGGATALRSGTLVLDGSGGVTGTGTVLDLSGEPSPLPQEVTGTYSVNASGLATLALDGGAAGSGVVGPEASYLFTFALGEAGIGVDFLLRID